MAYGWWGSRLPVGNLISSKLVQLLVGCRLLTQRMRFHMRTRLKGTSIQQIESRTIAEEMRKWLNAGYDKLNVGGGPRNLTGFVNIDLVRHESVEREIVANALDLSFVPSNRISQVHSSHMLEHLRPEHIPLQLDQYYRVLKSDGILTLRIPNALGASYAFWFEPIMEAGREAFIADGYPNDEVFGDPREGWLHKDLYGLLHWFYGEVGNPLNEHLSRITPSWLESRLEAAGFRTRRISLPEALNIVVVAEKANARR